MAGTCLIPVTQSYLDGLINLVQYCQAKTAQKYCKYRVTKKKSDIDITLKNTKILSDILFYLDMWDISTDDCKYVHCLKEKAMQICEFNEDEIDGAALINGLLTEKGALFLTEDETKFLIVE